MRKYLKIIIGLIRLLIEEILNGFKIKLNGITYCINSGVKFWIHSGGKCNLGRKIWISENCIFECNGGNLIIGFNNFFNSNCRISSINSIEIGNNNLFGPNVIIVDHNHSFKNCEKLICKQGFTNAPVKIGSNIWVGGNCTICEGVTIIDNIVVGANSVVVHDLLEPGVYIGSPARKVKDLY